MQALASKALTESQLAQYQQDGYLVVPHIISPEEAAQLAEHYMKIVERPGIEGYDAPSDAPRIYPRLMFPHRYDAWSRRVLLDRKIEDVLADVMGEEPVAAQTMMFYKPPGAKGQALHQDNFYLKVKPGTCVAVWIALDDTDEENGALQVVPGTGNAALECPHKPDSGEFFNNSEVYLPEGASPVTVSMKAGDALVFGGSLIHGSLKTARASVGGALSFAITAPALPPNKSRRFTSRCSRCPAKKFVMTTLRHTKAPAADRKATMLINCRG